MNIYCKIYDVHLLWIYTLNPSYIVTGYSTALEEQVNTDVCYWLLRHPYYLTCGPGGDMLLVQLLRNHLANRHKLLWGSLYSTRNCCSGKLQIRLRFYKPKISYCTLQWIYIESWRKHSKMWRLWWSISWRTWKW